MVRFKVWVRFRIKVRVKDSVRVGIIFRVKVQCHLLIKWRVIGKDLSTKHLQYACMTQFGITHIEKNHIIGRHLCNF